MSIKLNSFILPDNVIKKMKDDIGHSRIKNIEIGFNLCTENSNNKFSNNKLHDESYCVGEECSVDIPKGCKQGKHVGLFHTHPGTDSEPSIQDIANAYVIGINCIGSTKDNDIKCYIRKDKDYHRESLETIITALVRYESPLHISEFPEEDIKNYRKWVSIRNDLKKHYLNTVNVI